MEYYSIILIVLLTSVTPGPNNISAFMFSVQFGYRNTLMYILGIASGTFALFAACGFLIDLLLMHVSQIGNYMRYFAFVYILYLAYKSLFMSFNLEASKSKHPNFLNGFFLQLVNPKALMFSITVFTSFITLESGNVSTILLVALAIAINTFFMVSLWSVLGNSIVKYIKNPRLLKSLNYSMAALLVFFAFKILDVY